jgi:cell division protein FtsZ
MSIKFKAAETRELRPRITVLGVGGAGGNAVNNMIAAKLEGVDFIVANTDAQALQQSKAERRIQLGARITEGLGAGARPDVGRAGAEESLDEILEHLNGSHMVFITAGMGGGTGTGAAPVIARAVREAGVLTVGVVTKPFAFEGDKRMRIAERGIEEMQAYVDTLIIIPNQNLFRIANDRTTFAQAFSMADDVLHSGVRGVTDLIVMPGLINLDFADIKTVMGEMGKAMMGTGEAEGEERALKAAEAAISNPLLDDVSMKGARGVLINITGGPDMMLFEVDQAANRIRAEVDPDANIIFGGTILENMEGRLRVSVVATGIEADALAKLPPNVEPLRQRMAKPVAAKPEATPMSNNPVLRQVAAISEEMNAPISPVEDEIFGAEETVEVEAVPFEPIPLRPEHASVPMAEPKKRRGLFGGWKDKKAEPRFEPMAAKAEPARVARTAAPATNTAEDLFPDHQKDDQFEIPAFLRRQTN